MAGFWLILGIILAWVVHAGVFFQTGHQWFEACWAAQNAHRSAQSPEEAIAWAQCGPVAQRALYDAGYVFPGNPEYAVTPALKALANACPSSYTTIPLSGVQLLAVEFIQQDGGPTLIDRFTPPDAMILRAFDKRWPNCRSVRIANGFPPIVMRKGEWGFETPCKPCEAEQKAKNER